MQCAGGFKTVYVDNAMLRSSISQKLEELAQRTAERLDKLELQDIQKILGYPTPME